MVAPIGNIANKFIFSTAFNSSNMSNSQEFVLPTVFPTNYTGMDISTEFVPVNSLRTSSTKKNLSRDSLMSSTCSSIIYHERMANNGMDIDPEPPLNLLLCLMRQSRRR